jgi:hypothetical protein
MGVFGCFEVTIGFGGDERVDYMTVDTKGIWRCYEIKASKKDFYSSAKKSFVGNFNFYVMPREVFEQVKQDIPDHIGVYCYGALVKRAKRRDLSVPADVLKDSMIRSLFRDYEKYVRLAGDELAEKYKREANEYKRERDNLKSYISELRTRLWYAERGMGHGTSISRT